MRLHEDGLMPEQIAERFGWLDSAGRPAARRVHKRLIGAGAMPHKTRNRNPSCDANQPQRQYVDHGLTLRQVAERLG